MLTTDDLRSLAADRIEELRAEAARERLGRLFGATAGSGGGFRHALGRALIAFGLIVGGDAASAAVAEPPVPARRPNPCDDEPMLRRAA
jgi:hypothetical protein